MNSFPKTRLPFLPLVIQTFENNEKKNVGLNRYTLKYVSCPSECIEVLWRTMEVLLFFLKFSWPAARNNLERQKLSVLTSMKHR